MKDEGASRVAGDGAETAYAMTVSVWPLLVDMG